MLRKPFFLTVSICLISLFSPFANGFWGDYVSETRMVYDIHDGKYGRSADDTVTTFDAQGAGSYVIRVSVAFNFFEDGNYIETVYWENGTDTYSFVGNRLQHSYTAPTSRTDTMRSFDDLY